ncbi:MAG: permease, partial [Planctomycetota bacterium]
MHRRALRYAFGTLLDDLAPWFLVGFVLSGLIVVALPDGFFDGALFSGALSMLVMLVAGVPLYVCATASTPIAAAMMAKGLEPGAALVFLLAGPATNVATILVVRDLLGRRALVVYLASIALMSLLLGSVTNRLYPAFGFDPTAMDVTPGAMQHGAIATASGVILSLLLARSAWNQRLGLRFGAFLRRVARPVGIDPTALPFKALGLALLLYAWGSTAVTVAGPGETVFVERFGRIVAERSEPGYVVHAPWPLAAARRVATREVRAVEFGVDRAPIADDVVDTAAMRAELERRERLEDQAEMMTAEGVFVAIEYAVQYRITDARAWRYGFSDPEALVRMLA